MEQVLHNVCGLLVGVLLQHSFELIDELFVDDAVVDFFDFGDSGLIGVSEIKAHASERGRIRHLVFLDPRSYGWSFPHRGVKQDRLGSVESGGEEIFDKLVLKLFLPDGLQLADLPVLNG